MIERKIQSVGQGSFAVSLPKEWVKKNNLENKKSVFFDENTDGSLVLLPKKSANPERLSNFSIKLEDYSDNISQVIYALYYIGAEKIIIFSENEILQETRSRIRETVSYMSGTETESETAKKIVLHILLDKSKVNVNNVISRVSILLQSSISLCMKKPDLTEIQRNELEIDRLFHLATKIIIISSNDSDILKSSGINHGSFIVPYLIISKKLENMADEIESLAGILAKTKNNQTKILLFDVKQFLKQSIVFGLLEKNLQITTATKQEKQKKDLLISKIDNPEIKSAIKTVYRFVYDIQEELVNMAFYKKLINDKII